MSTLNPLNPVKFFKFCPNCGYSPLTKHSEKSFLCKKCDFTYYFNASGAVIALIFNKKGELLTTRRAFDPQKGTLDLPGGFVDPDETVENALIREIKEELNLDIHQFEYLYSHSNRYPFSGIYVSTVDLVFAVEVNDFSGLHPADDVSECIFFPIEELKPELFGLKSVAKVIEKVKNGRKH